MEQDGVSPTAVDLDVVRHQAPTTPHRTTPHQAQHRHQAQGPTTPQTPHLSHHTRRTLAF